MKVPVGLLASLMLLISTAEAATSDRAIQQILRKQDCFKCHAVSRAKDGPSFQEIAKEYADDPAGADKLNTHLTTTPEIEVDGNKEKHEAFEGDPTDVITWILSR